MDEKPITAEPVKKARSRWMHLSPDRLVIGLLLGVCLLWLSERFQWSGFNRQKGWTVLIAVAAVALLAFVMYLWLASSLLFNCRFQFGIRSVLAFCLACSIAVSWLAVEMGQARRQAEAVQWINSVGGAVYDWQLDAHGRLRLSEPPEPRWLQTMLGNDFFSTVVRVTCNGTTITDAGLEQLKGLTQLRDLNLDGTKITDAGLENVTGLSSVKYLHLAGTNITDAGLELLKGLTQLRGLSLSGTNITDAGLERLKDLTQLQQLILTDTKITDIGLEHLKSLTRLQQLILNGTMVTDAVLEHVKGLTQLQQLIVYGTKITDAGVNKLQQALPSCEIDH